jgi:hypothetical protein
VRASEVGAATAWLTLLVVLATGSGLLGWTALREERAMDADALYSRDLQPLPSVSDLTPTTVDLPRDLYFARQLHEGRVASWNPFSACGAPLWAEQGGPFFPLKLPFYLAPSPRTYDGFLALRLLAAGLGAYVLARYRGYAHLPGLAAAATFEFSGGLIEPFQFGAASAVYVLPWVLLGAAAIVRRCDGTAIAGAAAALAVAASGGHPTLILLVCTAFGLAVVAGSTRAWRTPRRALSIVAGGALAGLLGLALAAPSLLPLAELVQVGTSYKYSAAGDTVWSLALDNSRRALPFALFAPGILATLQPQYAFIRSAAMVGVVALVLAIAGMLRGGLDRGLVAVALLGVGLAVAPPGLDWLGRLPGLHLIQPYYACVLLALALTQATAAAVEGLDRPAGRFALLLALVAVAAGLYEFVLAPELARSRSTPLQFDRALREVLATPDGRLRVLVPPLLAAAAVAACYAARRTRAARWCASGIVVLAAAELLVLSRPWLQLSRSETLAAPPSPAVQWLSEHLDESRFHATPIGVGFALTPMFYGLRDVRGVSALPVRRYVEYVSAASPTEGVHQAIARVSSPLLDLAAARYLVLLLNMQGAPSLAGPDAQLVYGYGDENLTIFENRAALPRARIAHQVISAVDEADARAKIGWAATQPGHADEIGMADAVVLEPDAQGGTAPAIQRPSDADEWVRMIDDTNPDALVLDASLSASGLVVLADTYYPGWTATLDDRPAPIYPANLLFRAVHVPPGRHRITFTYAPRSLTIGAWIAAVAALVCAVLVLTSRKRRAIPTPNRAVA